MNIQQLRRNRDYAGLVYFLGFMNKICWEQPKDFVPLKRDDKKKTRTRIAMEKATQYIVNCEVGIGLDSKKFVNAMSSIKNWKYWFVEYMQDKDNQQLIEDCERRITQARRVGKKVKCDHKGNHKLGKHGAAMLADNLFRMFYDGEMRAKQEQPIDPYWTRDAGPVEWGRSMGDSDHLPRQFAEQPTGEFYLQSEDEHAVSWKLVDGGEFFTDDEVTEDQEIFPVKVDWEDRNDRYFDLRQDILHRKFSPQKILQKALMMARTELIGWGQFHKLRTFAADVSKYGNANR